MCSVEILSCTYIEKKTVIQNCTWLSFSHGLEDWFLLPTLLQSSSLLAQNKSHKDWTWKVDEPRAYYTEWSKLEREKQILYTNAYMWDLARWYWWTYLQGNSGDTGIENRLMDTVGRGKKERVGESNTETYIAIYKTDSQWEFALWLRELTLGSGSRGSETT